MDVPLIGIQQSLAGFGAQFGTRMRGMFKTAAVALVAWVLFKSLTALLIFVDGLFPISIG